MIKKYKNDLNEIISILGELYNNVECVNENEEVLRYLCTKIEDKYLN